MTVEELITQLQQLSPKAKVFYYDSWWEETENENGSWDEREMEIEKEIMTVSKAEDKGIIYLR